MMKTLPTAEVGLFDINFDTGERYWSRELRHLLSIPDEAPAEFHLLLRRVHPEDRARVMAAAMESFRPDCPAHDAVEFRVIDPEGTVHWVHMERGIIFRADEPRDAVRVVGFAFEIAQPMAAQL